MGLTELIESAHGRFVGFATNYHDHLAVLPYVVFVVLGVYFLNYYFVQRWDDVLYKAVKEGKVLEVQGAIRKGANLETKRQPRPEWTPLIIATLQNNLAIVTLLLAAGAKTEARDEEGRTSLMLAAQKGFVEIAQALLAKGSDPTAKSYDGWTALIIACYAGHTELVHILLARCGQADIKWRTKQGLNALAIAVGQHHMPGGRMKIIKMLLSNDAKVDSRTLSGWTSLIKAAYGGHDDVMQLLLASGADINAAAQNGFTALIAAAQNGWIDCVSLLLEKGAECNAKTSDGSTALIAACNGGYTEIVELLLSYGADMHVRYKNGATALMAATYRGHKDIAFLLIDRADDDDVGDEGEREGSSSGSGSNKMVDAVNQDGWNALLVAVDRGRLGITTKLILKGSDVNQTSTTGWTCLMSACQHGYEDIVDVLLEHGAECNVSQADGWSPLLIAASGGWENIVRKLLDVTTTTKPALVDGYGSSANLVEGVGEDGEKKKKEHVPTPLVAACSFGYTSIVVLLLARRADRKAVDALGRNCLEIAIALRHLELIDVLVEAGFSASGLDGVRLNWYLVKNAISVGLGRRRQVQAQAQGKNDEQGASAGGVVQGKKRDKGGEKTD